MLCAPNCCGECVTFVAVCGATPQEPGKLVHQGGTPEQPARCFSLPRGHMRSCPGAHGRTKHKEWHPNTLPCRTSAIALRPSAASDSKVVVPYTHTYMEAAQTSALRMTACVVFADSARGMCACTCCEMCCCHALCNA
jgi:hypothetical protein